MVVEEVADKTAVKPKRLSSFKVEQRIIEFAQVHDGKVRQSEVSSMFGLSERQTREYLSKMSSQGVFVKSGSKKERVYTLMKNK